METEDLIKGPRGPGGKWHDPEVHTGSILEITHWQQSHDVAVSAISPGSIVLT